MKILIILILLSCSVYGQREPSIKGYRHELKLKSNPELDRYDSSGKKLYVIWRQEKIFIYPNPTRGMVYFSEVGDVILRDVTGRLIKIEKNTDNINLYGLAAGSYFITIITEDTKSHHVSIKL